MSNEKIQLNRRIVENSLLDLTLIKPQSAAIKLLIEEIELKKSYAMISELSHEAFENMKKAKDETERAKAYETYIVLRDERISIQKRIEEFYTAAFP